MGDMRKLGPLLAVSLMSMGAASASATAMDNDGALSNKELMDIIRQQHAEIAQLQNDFRQLSAQLHDADAVRKPAAAAQAAPGADAEGGNSNAGATKMPGTARIGKANVSLAGSWLEGVIAYRKHNELASASGSSANTPFPNAANYHLREMRIDTRGTRVSVSTFSDKFGDDEQLRGRLQLDFASVGNGNQNNGNWSPRLRQGWFMWDKNAAGWHFLAGQNWSLVTPGANFMAANGGPGNDLGWTMRPGSENVFQQLDAFIPGYVGTRQPQFRVVKDLMPGAALGFSIENPSVAWGGTTAGITSAALSPAAAAAGTSSSQLSPTGALGTYASSGYLNTTGLADRPAFVLKSSWQPGPRLLLEAYGIVRNYRNMPGLAGPAGAGAVSTTAGGAGTYLKIVPNKVDLSLAASYGSLGGMDSSGAIPDVTTDSTGKPVAVKSTGGWAGLYLYPSKDLTLFALAGYTRGHAAGISSANGINYGYGNPANRNSGCGVLGGACNGNIDTASAMQIAANWRIYNGDKGQVMIQPQISYIKETRFSDINGIRPAAGNLVINLGIRYFPF